MNEAGSPELALEDLRWVQALAARLVSDPHLADDAVQQTLVVALERRPRAVGSLRAWLGAILRNALRQEWRGRARRARRELEARPARDERSTLEVVEELALHRRLVERVQALDEPYRTAIVLRYLRGREVTEIAQELGVPPKTVRTRLERALERLRERLGAEREAWLLLLFPSPVPSPTPTLAPALPALLVPMNLKVVAAVLGLFLVGALLYLRGGPSASSPIQEPPVVAAAAPEPALRPLLDAPPALGREERPSAGVPDLAARGEARPTPLELHGFVRTLDGRGLDGVEIVFEPGSKGIFGSAEAPATTSGAQGAFALPCPTTAGRLNLRSEDFVGVALPHLEGTLPLTTPILVAAPLRRYAGRVVDVGGAALPGARVELTLDGSFVQSRDVGGEAVHLLLPFAETTCDDAGRFAFERAGYVAEALLVASASGYRAAQLDVPPESSAGLEIALAPEASDPRTIFGLVLDAREAPVAGAQVSLGGPTVASDAAGRFRLECEIWRKAGWIRAYRDGALPAELALETALRGSSPDHPLVLHLGGEPRSIRGRVLGADGTPVAGACVWTPDTTPFGEVEMREGENVFSGGTTVEALLTGNRTPWASQISTVTDARGEFTLRGLLERDYALFALDAHTLDGVGPIAAAAGDEQVVLRLPGAERVAVAGRIVSRTGVPLAGVSVAPGRRFDWRADETPGAGHWIGFAIASPFAAQTFPASAVVTDADGHFELAPLVPAGAFLALRGKPLVLGDAYELDARQDPGALEIAVDASARFRVTLARAGEADAFRLETSAGEHLPLFLEVEGVTISAASASIEHGRSGIALAAEGDTVLVLLDGVNEVRRVPIHLPAGGLHELAP